VQMGDMQQMMLDFGPATKKKAAADGDKKKKK